MGPKPAKQKPINKAPAPKPQAAPKEAGPATKQVEPLKEDEDDEDAPDPSSLLGNLIKTSKARKQKYAAKKHGGNKATAKGAVTTAAKKKKDEVVLSEKSRLDSNSLDALFGGPAKKAFSAASKVDREVKKVATPAPAPVHKVEQVELVHRPLPVRHHAAKKTKEEDIFNTALKSAGVNKKKQSKNAAKKVATKQAARKKKANFL